MEDDDALLGFEPQEGPDLFGELEAEPAVAPEPARPKRTRAKKTPADEQTVAPDDEQTVAPDDDHVAPDEPAAAPDEAASVEGSGPGPVAGRAGESTRPAAPAAPLALYRRYRPDVFADVIGQEHVTEPLQRALANNKVSHAYLFSGPRGCGKTTSARILARALNCERGPTPEPCGVCPSCRDLGRGGGGSIDVIEIDAASHGGVDDARDLRERAFFAPVHSRYKIYIVDEAHMVTAAGFNALLKVVEEPPPHVKFIFATTEPEKVIGTIRSRTHHYPFRLVPPKVLGDYLRELCDSEGVDVEPAVLPLVVRAGAGSVRDSLSVLDQLLGGAGTGGVTYDQAVGLLGFTPDSLLDEMVDAFAAGDGAGVFATIDKVVEVGQDSRRFAEDLLRRLRDLVIVAAVPDAVASGLIDAAGDQADRLAVQAQGLGAGELTRAAEVVAQGLVEMRGTTAPRLHLELMCARVLLPGADVEERGVHARLDRLERRLGMPGEPGSSPAPGQRRDDSWVLGETAPPRPEASPRGGMGAGSDAGAGAAGRAAPTSPRPPVSPDSGRSASSAQPSGPVAGPGQQPGEGLRPVPAPDADATPAPAAGAVPAPAAGAGLGPAADAVPAPAADSGWGPATDAVPAPAADSGWGPAAGTVPAPAGDTRAAQAADADAVAARSRGGSRPNQEPPPEEEWEPPSDRDQATLTERPTRPATLADVAPSRPEPTSGHGTHEPRQGAQPPRDSDRPAPGAETPERAQASRDPGAVVGAPDQSPAGLGAADVRRLWPEVLAAVMKRRRVTWMRLKEHAQVSDVRDGVLTLTFAADGIREQFAKGGHDDILRDALVEVMGADLRIVAVAEGATPPARSGGSAASARGADRSQAGGDDTNRLAAGERPATHSSSGRSSEAPGVRNEDAPTAEASTSAGELAPPEFQEADEVDSPSGPPPASPVTPSDRGDASEAVADAIDQWVDESHEAAPSEAPRTSRAELLAQARQEARSAAAVPQTDPDDPGQIDLDDPEVGEQDAEGLLRTVLRAEVVDDNR